VSTLENRPHTALVVIDVQNGVAAGAHRRDAVVTNIVSLADRARAAEVQVVWVQHSDDHLEKGSAAWQYVPELGRRDGEVLVHKSHNDSFEATGLEEVLAGAGVGRPVLAGPVSAGTDDRRGADRGGGVPRLRG
jgi:nicotinamidase-related amidase